MNVKKYIQDTYKYWMNIRFILPQYLEARKKIKSLTFDKPDFLSDIQTVDLLVNRKMSLSRFGDGEFGWMAGQHLSSFQEYSDAFAEDLRSAFCTDNPNLLIGIPIGLFDTKGLNFFSRMYWTIIKASSYNYVKALVNYNKVYANASITRPYIDYRSRSFSRKAFENVKRIWDKREIIIVEGEHSRLGVGNDLFGNSKSIKRILCPTINAYSKINEIEDYILKNVNKSALILGALGPTASILASHLSKLGYQFVDIGHIDVEYMWYLNRSILRDAIPGRYVNESSEKITNIEIDNENYQKSIIAQIL
jgi:glycosyltransferase family protein